jgi:hypothetical protein
MTGDHFGKRWIEIIRQEDVQNLIVRQEDAQTEERASSRCEN